MRYELKSVDVLSASKMAAIFYFFLTLIFCVPMGFLMAALPHKEVASPFFGLGVGAFMLLMPFVYAGFGFVFSAIACFVYNLLAKWMGGISFDFEAKA